MSGSERQITEPGVYDDLPHDRYLADPVPWGSLSASGARKLLPPSCPALYRYWVDHPEPPRDHFDFGHAAHRMVLGAGQPIVVVQKVTKDKSRVDAADYQTRSAQQHRDAIRAEGGIPLLRHELARVQAMADAIRAHPIAAALFDPDRGRPEVSLFWEDDETEVWRRARLDWLPDPRDGRLIVADYKTTGNASPEVLPRSCADYGYALQARWYLDAVEARDLAGDVEPAFVFVFQAKDPPHLITVAELDRNALRIGDMQAREALRVYRECIEKDDWPTWSDEVVSLSLPTWYERQYEEAW